MDLSPGLGYGGQIYFPVIEQVDGGFTHSVASLWIARSIHNSLRIGNATGRSSFAEAKLP